MATDARLTQYVIEAFEEIGSPTRLTQYVIEALSPIPGTPARITQQVIEYWYTALTPPVPFSGIYFAQPNKTNDTLYTSISADNPPAATSDDFAIPNPFAEQALIGDK